MKRSLSSVFIVVGSLFAAFLITWFYLRTKAAEKPIKTPFPHAFVKSTHGTGQKALLLRTHSPAEISARPISSSNGSKYSVVIWLDVRLAGENQLVISSEELLTQGPAKGKPIEIATRTECKDAGLFELADFYDILRDRPVVLNLISRRPGLSQRILEIWGAKSASKPLSVENVVMQSESEGTLKELREAEPRGLYGSSQATLIQMEVLSNLGLASLMDLKSDILISAIEERRGGEMQPRVRSATLEEAHRRGLKRYAGPTRNRQVALDLIEAGYDGVLIESRETLDSFLQADSQ